MIFEVILFLFFLPAVALLRVVPDIPVPPQVVIDSLDVIRNYAYSTNDFMMFWVGSTLWTATVAVVLSMIVFVSVYKVSMFVIRKIPFINIS